MTDLGKLLIVLGLVLAALGLLLTLLGRLHGTPGHLPGDLFYRGKNLTVYFPLGTSLLLSAVLTLVLYLVTRMRR
jgi:hypothetical protein